MGGWFRKQLPIIRRHFFLQDKSSIDLLVPSINYTNTTFAGGQPDLTSDRGGKVLQSNHFYDIAAFVDMRNKQFCRAGSTWPDDGSIGRLLSVINTGLQLIIAPHEVKCQSDK